MPLLFTSRFYVAITLDSLFAYLQVWMILTSQNPCISNIFLSKDNQSMYPKVKVRQEEEEEEEDPPKFQRIYLKDYQSSNTTTTNTPGPEHKDNYTPPRVRVPKSPHISTSDAKISARFRAGKVNRKVAQEKKPNKVNIKPTSVLPPRAVLSSPENDAMVRTKNKTKTQHLGLRNHNSFQNTHVKCKKSYELDKRGSSWEH